MELTLKMDKMTDDVVRFGDLSGHYIYLKPEEIKTLDNAGTIKVKIEKGEYHGA